ISLYSYKPKYIYYVGLTKYCFVNSDVIGKHNERQGPIILTTKMTAKEKQAEFIKSYLKPTLKQNGYQTSAQTWWKDKGDFFNVINLQNYSWNSKDIVDFRFNIGIALKATVK